MSLGSRVSAKRLCIESCLAPLRPLTASASVQAAPPLPKGRDNRGPRQNEGLLPIVPVTDLQVPSADLRDQKSLAASVRKFWQANFPSATFENKDEFAQWYVKYSTILVIIIGGIITWRRMSDKAPDVIGPDHFVKLKVITRTRIAPDSVLLQLDLPRDALPPIQPNTPVGLNAPVQSVYVADSDSMIQRPYTPLSAEVFDRTSERNTGKLDLLVKYYEGGEVSRWLHSRAVGAMVPIRGPVSTWDITSRKVDDLVLLVAGTGITPAFQIISALYDPPTLKPQQQELLFGKRQNMRLENQAQAVDEAAMEGLSWLERFNVQVARIREDRDRPPPSAPPLLSRPPRITLLYASNATDSIYLRQTLEAYEAKYADRIRTAFWADKLTNPAQWKRAVKIGRMNVADLARHGGLAGDYPDPRKTAVLVCGPDSFVDAMAGPAPSSQTPALGGMLHDLGWTAEQIIRLDNHPRVAQVSR